MSIFTTSKGHAACHCHLGGPPISCHGCNDQGTDACARCKSNDYSPSDVARIREWFRRQHPHARESGPPTLSYNCIGFALAQSHGWFGEHQIFLDDDFDEVTGQDPQTGDVLVYKNGAVFTHIAVVTGVTNGEITEVRSKWAGGSEVFHTPCDVLEGFGAPVSMHRPQLGPIAFRFCEVEMIDLGESKFECDRSERDMIGRLIFNSLQGSKEMSELDSSITEVVQSSLEKISDPDEYIKVNFASTPAAAGVIIELIPGVHDLISLGPQIGGVILNFLQKATDQGQYELAAIALHVLQRVESSEAIQPLARAISEGRFEGMNLQLAAHAFLSSAHIDTFAEDPVEKAYREAENLK